ncbi:lipoate--protein ligase family protein [Bradyrhizobium liaoningense]
MPSPEAALRLELDLLDAVAEGRAPATFALWSGRESLIVPRPMSKLESFAMASSELAARGWPVLVRETGGDLFPQSPGILNLTLCFPLDGALERSIDRCYKRLCEPIVEALRSIGITASFGPVRESLCDGAYNIVVGGRKIAGTAQRWRRSRNVESGKCAALAHAGIFCDVDFAELCKVSNTFFAACGLERRVVDRQHVSVAAAIARESNGRRSLSWKQEFTSHLSRILGNGGFFPTVTKWTELPKVLHA